MRYLLISDIHANLCALEAVLNDADGQYDSTWFLGDAVGYGPHPNECIELLSSLSCLGVAGNHDWAVLDKLSAQHFNPEARSVLMWTRSVATPTSLHFLESLATGAVVGDFTLVHGSPREPIWEYILHPAVATANLTHFATPYCLVGHTHSPAMYECPQGRRRTCRKASLRKALAPRPLPDARLILNPGSVGQPRDGNPDASYAILDSQTRTLWYRRVVYPVQHTQAAMLALGFPARLINRLALGR
jgi:predicted phosphodiesterase